MRVKPEIILVHGWDPNYYNKNVTTKESNSIAWANRPELINLLNKGFNIKYCNLPGFCGVPEPNKYSYTVEEFSDYLAEWKSANSPDAALIMGYSFGGAVTLYYKHKYKDKTPLVLASPAIIRGETVRSTVAGKVKSFVPKSLVKVLKDAYQRMVNKYYRYGTSFLRASYDKVVREDLRPLISKVKIGEIYFIYGENDADTPWSLVSKTIMSCGHKYTIIPNGGHNIGETHPRKIVKILKKYLSA